MKIQENVLEVLRSCTTKENILFLPQKQLDRKLYVDVNKCLESIGGVWNRKEKGHIFDHDPSDDLDEMINTGEWVDVKKEYQFFETPSNIVDKMIELAEIKEYDFLLEPNAGNGNIVDRIPKGNIVYLCELNEKCCNILLEKGYIVDEGDFLQKEYEVDKVIMNPPFSKHQDIDHILHAWDCLLEGGRLVSVVSESPFFRTDKKSVNFRQWLMENDARVIPLEEGTFKESGTMIRTRIIVVDKQ